MTTEKEQEAFGFVIDRHKNAVSGERHKVRVPAIHGNRRLGRSI